MVRLVQWGVFAWIAGLLACCGKAPIKAPATSARVAGYLFAGEPLKASRLAVAGCMQVTEDGPKRQVGFFKTDCPENEETPLTNAAFALDIDLESNGHLVLSKGGVKVGFAEELRLTDGKKLPRGKLLHLCQISDPTAAAQRFFSELCRVEFQTEATSSDEGRFASLDLVSPEELAQSKLKEQDAIRREVLVARQKMVRLEVNQDAIRHEMERARTESQEAREALAEAQRSVRDSMASNQTVHRTLEKEKAEYELRAALDHVKVLEIAKLLAKREQRHAALLKERLENSESARQREGEIQKQLGIYEQARIKGEQYSSLKTIYDQNHGLILSDPVKRQIEEEMNIAISEAQKLDKLEKEDLPAAYNLVIQKRDAAAKLERIPPEGNPSIEGEQDPDAAR